jgi:K+-sensing histidine kinase KdpD
MIKPMQSHSERVLLIESDPEIRRLIAEEALIPLGYLVDVYESTPPVMQEIENLAPDVILTELNLTELSGKDLILALGALGSTIPVIVISKKDQEMDILQAIRLGVADFLISPLREAEVVSVVENVLNKHHMLSQAESIVQKLDETKTLLDQQRANFSELLSFCKFVLSSKGVHSFGERITSLALHLTTADCAWYSIFEDDQAKFQLQACQNLPEGMQSSFSIPYEDELSALVAASGQVVALHGEVLRQFKSFETFGAVMIVPVMHDDKKISVIVVSRKEPQNFTNYQQTMLELVAEIASATLENNRRFQQLEHMMVLLQQANVYATIEGNLKYDLLRQASLELRSPLKYLMENVDYILDNSDEALHQDQTAILNNILDQAEVLMDISDSMINYRQVESIRLETVDLNEIVRNATNRIRPIAQMGKITINLELSPQPALIKAYPSQITRVFEGLLSNSLKYSPADGEVSVRIEEQDADILLSVSDQGTGIDSQMADRIFDIKSSVFGYTPRRFGGIGISMPRIKEVISAYKGSIWIEPMQGNGFRITFSLPRLSKPVDEIKK